MSISIVGGGNGVGGNVVGCGSGDIVVVVGVDVVADGLSCFSVDKLAG